MKRIVSFILFVLFLPPVAWAATHYVSPSGASDGSAWAHSESISDPCTAAIAMTNAMAGDVVYFRGGTYSVAACSTGGFGSSLYPSNSGTAGNYITFQAYPGETPIIHCPSINAGWWNNCNIGTGNQDYIIWDGFTCTAGASNEYAGGCYVGGDNGGSDYCIIRNCTFTGGASTNVTIQDNSPICRFHEANYNTISNCTFAYNKDDAYSYNGHAGILSYYSDYNTVENCYFHHVTAGIYLKSYNDHWTIRNNYIYYTGVGIFCATASHYSTNHSIYNNIVNTFFGAGISIYAEPDGDHVNGALIYNNTVYTAGNIAYDGIAYSPHRYSDNASVYNNLVSIGGTNQSSFFYYSGADMDTSDYNLVRSSFTWYCGGSPYYNIATYRAASCSGLTGGAHDTHSIASNPTFTNGSGTMTLVSDFLLASGSAGKNAGSDGKDIGADVSLVGVDAGEEDTTAPASIHGVSLHGVDMH